MACHIAERRTNSNHGTVVLQPTLPQPMLDLGSSPARYPVDYLEGLASLDSLDLGSLLNDSDLFGDVHRLAYCAGRRAEQPQQLYWSMTNRKRKWERQCSQNPGKRIKTEDNGRHASRSAPNPPVFPPHSTPLQLTNSEAIVSTVDSFPNAATTSTKSTEPGAVSEHTRRRGLQMEVPMGMMLSVKELDAHILKLQAVRATLLDGANVAGLVEGRPDGMVRMAQGTSSHVPVSIVSVGVQALDEPLFDETSSLVNRVGCLNHEFNETISNFKQTCYINDECRNVEEDIGRCLAFISDHTSMNQRTLARNSYRGMQFNPSVTAPQVQRAIEAANEALKVAQCITLFSTYITNRLGVMVESATRKVCDCDRVCQEQMIVERQQVRAILRGNHAAVLHAAKTWVKTTEDASTAIRMLIEGVHAA